MKNNSVSKDKLLGFKILSTEDTTQIADKTGEKVVPKPAEVTGAKIGGKVGVKSPGA